LFVGFFSEFSLRENGASRRPCSSGSLLKGKYFMKAIVFGCGGRGRTYARYSRENKIEIAAAADPNAEKLRKFGQDFSVPRERLFTDYRRALDVDADAVINSTPDRAHYETTVAALDRGCHVLLEKPMSPEPEECLDMLARAESGNRLLMVCHVLRYAPFFVKLKELIESGAIGRLMQVQLVENVASWHFVHSYVRGIFRSESISSPFILAKSCHDLDIILYLTSRNCVSVVSEGSLSWYREENAPEGAPASCLDGCPHEKSCPHFAPALYLKQITAVGWPTETISADTSFAARYKALQTGGFGRCAFRCDNDVCDHQSAIFQMEGGLIVSFSMTGFSSENTRTIRVYGTKGDIRGHLDKGALEMTTFLDGRKTVAQIDADTLISGHGGGDARLLRDFAEAVAENRRNVRTSAALSAQSHFMAFAAEKSRKEGRRIKISEMM
jgi:predicted dehydrogenase